MFMDSIRKQTQQWTQYKLKIVYKTWHQKHSGKQVLKKIYIILGSHTVVLVKTFQLMTDIDEARVISVLQSKSTINYDLLRRENLIFEFPCWCTRKDFSINVSITTVRLILMKLGWFLFGHGWHDFGILIWKHTNNLNSRLKITS